MVLKRGGRKMYKKRRAVRRGYKRLGMRRSKYADTHSFKTTSLDTSLTNIPSGDTYIPKANGQMVLAANPTTVAGSNRTWLSGVFTFQAQYSNQWTQLNSMFDRYHVNGIKVRFIPEFNVQDSTLITTIPTIKVVRDMDDNQTSTVGDLWSRRGVQRRLDKPFSVYIRKPKVLTSVLAFQGAGGNSVVSAGIASPYLNCGNGNVHLLGLKFAIKDWPIVKNSYAPNVVLRTEITYYFTFKQQINPNLALTADGGQLLEEDQLVGEPDAVPCENEEVLAV